MEISHYGVDTVEVRQSKLTKESAMFAHHTQDSFSEGLIYPGRALAAICLLVVLSVLLSSL
jgi:hypothetical protein